MVKKESKNILEIKNEKKDKKFSIISYFKKLRDLFFHPSAFLNSIDSEKKYFSLIVNFLVIYIFYFLAVWLANIKTLFSESTITEIISGVVLAILFYIIIGIALLFAVSGLIYLGVLLFKGKKGFFNVYKPVAYALIICYIYMIISLIVSFIFPFSTDSLKSIESIEDVEVLKEIYKQFFLQPGAIVSLVIGFVSMVHSFIFLSKAISKFQEIKYKNAMLSVITSLVILIATIIFIAILLNLSGI